MMWVGLHIWVARVPALASLTINSLGRLHCKLQRIPNASCGQYCYSPILNWDGIVPRIEYSR